MGSFALIRFGFVVSGFDSMCGVWMLPASAGDMSLICLHSVVLLCSWYGNVCESLMIVMLSVSTSVDILFSMMGL